MTFDNLIMNYVTLYASPDFVVVQSDNPDPANFSWVGWESDAYNRLMIINHFPKAMVRHRVDSMLVLNSLVLEGFGASVLACYWEVFHGGVICFGCLDKPDQVPLYHLAWIKFSEVYQALKY